MGHRHKLFNSTVSLANGPFELLDGASMAGFTIAQLHFQLMDAVLCRPQLLHLSTESVSVGEAFVELGDMLAQHPDFVITNPNRLRSLAGTFAGNHWAFHSADGRGYTFLADMIIAAEKLNPQVAARLVPPLGRWRRFEPKRAAMMRQALERIAATPELSKDVYEQVTKSLG